MAVKLRLCEAGDIEYIAANMRAVDAEEIRLAGNHDPFECLTQGASHSVYCRVIEINGRPAAILGLVPLDNVNGRGICWLLGTDDIEQHAKAFLRTLPAGTGRHDEKSRTGREFCLGQK